MAWLVLCAAGGCERDAERIINRAAGASYLPMHQHEGKWRLLLPGYVFATWLHAVPWHKLEDHTTQAGLPLIYGYLRRIGSDVPARVSQEEVDVMQAYAAMSAREHEVPAYKTGDLIAHTVGIHGAEIPLKVRDIVDGLMTLEVMMLGRMVRKQMMLGRMVRKVTA